jgi:hypothetical protein
MARKTVSLSLLLKYLVTNYSQLITVKDKKLAPIRAVVKINSVESYMVKKQDFTGTVVAQPVNKVVNWYSKFKNFDAFIDRARKYAIFEMAFYDKHAGSLMFRANILDSLSMLARREVNLHLARHRFLIQHYTPYMNTIFTCTKKFNRYGH